ncbi:hypothetical protein [Stenotrophomonas maltophilia]|uniref:hypothetical protein n=1 Tax=Stenotrophomonas maltophilia TaxID=40324 RepID=UPI0013DA43B6|nr:hypothetical protein [Stenotrophomonas maltophilia]USA18747.1 hypothetical protein NDK23_10805 [Stenotrophomonas maltophilia]
MSAPVDVLAVMDRAIERAARPHTEGLHEARVSVSALIGVVQSGKRDGDEQERREWLAELDGALARVQGGAA